MGMLSGSRKSGIGWIAMAFVAALAGCQTSPLGRKQLLLVPDTQMAQMGAQAFDQMKGQTPTVSDPKMNAYVKCVAQPLLQAAKSDLETDKWEIVVFKDDSANAFALPGGKIGVHTGLFKVAKNQAMLATVLGHEVGHVVAKHSSERVSQQVATQGGLSLISAFLQGTVSPQTNNLLIGALGLGTQVGVLLPFGRTQESESDLIGLKLMSEAGFDPRDSVTLWENMIKEAGGQSPPEFISTHPASENRIRELQAHMKDAMSQYEQARSSGRVPNCGQAPI